MSHKRSPIIAGLLAITLVATTAPLLPSSGAASPSDTSLSGTCGAPGDPTHEEQGYVKVTHPDIENTRVSQGLAFFVLDGGLAERWTNGLDSYVVELPCTTSSTQDVCVERRAPDTDEGFPILAQDAQQPDIKLEFYDKQLGSVGTVNPNVPADDESGADSDDVDCKPAPSSAKYSVVYLADGIPEGFQFHKQLWGPYTEHFIFRLY